MVDTVWNTGEIIEIYQNCGTGSGKSKIRIRKAPFNLLRWAKTPGGVVEDYILPVGFDNPTFNLYPMQDEQTGMEFGYLSGEQFMLDSHVALNDCHQFGFM